MAFPRGARVSPRAQSLSKIMVAAAPRPINAAPFSLDLRAIRVSPGIDVAGAHKGQQYAPALAARRHPWRRLPACLGKAPRRRATAKLERMAVFVSGILPTVVMHDQSGQKCLQWVCD